MVETPPRHAAGPVGAAPASSGSESRSVLRDVAPGDALMLVALVPAPSLRRAVSSEAADLLAHSLARIVEEEVASQGRVVPWLHGQLLAILPATSRADAVELGHDVKRRWHSAWTAPVAVATGVGVVDEDTPAPLAVMLAGAEVGEAKDSVAHA